MSSKKLGAEIEKCLREAQTNMQVYDLKWRELKSYNEATANPDWATLGSGVIKSPAPELLYLQGLKLKKLVTQPTFITVDISNMNERQVTEAKEKLKNELEALMKKVYRSRQQLIEWLNHAELRQTGFTREHIMDAKREIECRHRRGKVYYLRGVSSEDTTNEQASQFNEVVTWLQEYIDKLRDRSDMFTAEIETLSKTNKDDARTGLLQNAVEMYLIHANKLDEFLRGIRNNTISVADGDEAGTADEGSVDGETDGGEGVNVLLERLEELRQILEPFIDDNEELNYVVTDDVYADLGIITEGATAIKLEDDNIGGSNAAAAAVTGSTTAEAPASSHEPAAAMAPELHPAPPPTTPVKPQMPATIMAPAPVVSVPTRPRAAIDIVGAPPPEVPTPKAAVSYRTVLQQSTSPPSQHQQQLAPPQQETVGPTARGAAQATSAGDGSYSPTASAPSSTGPAFDGQRVRQPSPTPAAQPAQQRLGSPSGSPGPTQVSQRHLSPEEDPQWKALRARVQRVQQQLMAPAWRQRTELVLADGVTANICDLELLSRLTPAVREQLLQQLELMAESQQSNTLPVLVMDDCVGMARAIHPWYGEMAGGRDATQRVLQTSALLYVDVGDVIEVLASAPRDEWTYGRLAADKSRQGWLPQRVLDSSVWPTSSGPAFEMAAGVSGRTAGEARL